MIIASHNIMHGRFVPALTRHHCALRDDAGLDLLCVQENMRTESGYDAHALAAALGDAYRVVCDPEYCRLAAVYDATKLTLLEERLVPLPHLLSLNWLERRYIIGGKTKQKYAQHLVFEAEGHEPFTVVNLHLDAAGGNAHRRAQVAQVAETLEGAGQAGRAVVCGDTNAFSWRLRTDELRNVMRPLAELGLMDEGSAPTHYFARQREPSLAARMCVMLGRLGLDLPCRYDVLYTSLPVSAHGQISTVESDHDLVWVRVEI